MASHPISVIRATSYCWFELLQDATNKRQSNPDIHRLLLRSRPFVILYIYLPFRSHHVSLLSPYRLFSRSLDIGKMYSFSLNKTRRLICSAQNNCRLESLVNACGRSMAKILGAWCISKTRGDHSPWQRLL